MLPGLQIARGKQWQPSSGNLFRFEHPAAVHLSQTADAVYKAPGKYMDWNDYYHKG